MNAKLAIALMLGLVFQFVQVLPGALASPPCESEATSCACCANSDPCHCADSNTPEQAPDPAPFDTSKLPELPVMKASETIAASELRAKSPLSSLGTTLTRVEPVSGYVGVPKSVAFCRFVI